MQQIEQTQESSTREMVDNNKHHKSNKCKTAVDDKACNNRCDDQNRMQDSMGSLYITHIYVIPIEGQIVKMSL